VLQQRSEQRAIAARRSRYEELRRKILVAALFGLDQDDHGT
jgi:hypothetical protein